MNSSKGSILVFLMITLPAFFMLSSIVSATTDIVGGTGTSWNNGVGYVFWTKITASSSGTLQTVGVNIQTVAGSAETAIYSDSSGPATLLGNSASIKLSSGWNDLTIPGSVSITSGTAYWLGIEVNSNSANVYFNSGSGEVFQSPGTYSYGTWANNPSTQSSTDVVNQRMTYVPATPTIVPAPTLSGPLPYLLVITFVAIAIWSLAPTFANKNSVIFPFQIHSKM